MPLYRRNPSVVEARHFVGTNAETHDIYCWVERKTQGSFDPYGKLPLNGVSIDPATGFMLLANPKGLMPVKIGDWVVEAFPGEFYSWTHEMFTTHFNQVDVATSASGSWSTVVL